MSNNPKRDPAEEEEDREDDDDEDDEEFEGEFCLYDVFGTLCHAWSAPHLVAMERRV